MIEIACSNPSCSNTAVFYRDWDGEAEGELHEVGWAQDDESGEMLCGRCREDLRDD